ncbi:hypothetical protein BH09SUM1_BH09SUM1_23540 [soil metagenome]
MSPIAAIKEQLAALSMKERDEVRDWLDAKDAPPGLVYGDREAFELEIRKRSEEVKSGAVKCIPWEEVDREMKEEYGLSD